MEEIKITDERLNALREIQEQYDIITKRYGEIAYEMKMIEQAFTDLEAERRNITSVIQTEMGTTGAVDLTTGVFIPD